MLNYVISSVCALNVVLFGMAIISWSSGLSILVN